MKKLTKHAIGFSIILGLCIVATVNADIKEGTGHESFDKSALVCSNSVTYHDNWCAKLIKCGAVVERKPMKEIKENKESLACKVCFKEID